MIVSVRERRQDAASVARIVILAGVYSGAELPVKVKGPIQQLAPYLYAKGMD
jgi:hypothetical protein